MDSEKLCGSGGELVDDELGLRWRELERLGQDLKERVGEFGMGPQFEAVLKRLEEQGPADLETAESLWSLCAVLWFQRAYSGTRSQHLGLLDSIVEDASHHLFSVAKGLGARECWSECVPSPVVLLEPMASPAVWVRGSRGRGAGVLGVARPFDLPMPVVFFPPHQVATPRAWGTIFHEVGHEFDTAFGVTEVLQSAVEELVKREGISHGLKWKDWVRETVADLLGLAMMGQKYMAMMRDVFERIGGAHASRSHPSGAQRLETLERAAHQWKLINEQPRCDSQNPFLCSYVDVLLQTKVSALAGHSLSELAIELGRRAEAEPPANLRELPALAWELDGTPEEILGRLHTEAQGLPSLKTPEQQNAEEWLHLEQPTFRPSMLEYERSREKTPPRQLLYEASRVAFVGATNDGLSERIKDALENGKGLRDVEVYFLEDDALRALAFNVSDADELVKCRDAACSRLEAVFRSCPNLTWSLRTYSEPYLFASYWDWESSWGRIHVSPNVWGQDRKRCPSVDYVSGDGHTYRALVDGLGELRKRSKLLKQRVVSSPLEEKR